MHEFTGERVIPGQVEIDLWNEHFARYAFASRFTAGAHVLDAGCGSGYGTAFLATRARFATGIDISPEAIAHARQHFSRPDVRFLPASAAKVPFRDGSFDVIVCFEVIEHLADWCGLLTEARRLLAPGGRFVVSTPNKDYYAASRGRSGPNPYHVHEFTAEEFRHALGEVFPYVTLFVQNQAPGFVFQPAQPGAGPDAHIESAEVNPEESNFFVAVCALEAPADVRPFVYVPRAANVLREREMHIEALEGWLAEARSEKQKLLEMFRTQTAELEERNRWAARLDDELHATQRRVAELQEELAREQAAAVARIDELEAEVRRRSEWALGVEMRYREQTGELVECVRLLDAAEKTVVERTEWARDLEARLQKARTRLALARRSLWMRLGRALYLVPDLGGE